ncbi:peptidoglycan-binding domain-containing protein [Dactylosporangium sp. NPDC050588]|uniref:peptidoglycan-binding domain-containing protein n=1 Tax=Dactylosporangium sp. NPDC050588 TaxID=3157211 RepID=UPI0033FFE28D
MARQQFDDPRPVDLDLDLDPKRQIIAQTSGTVTDLQCRSGGDLVSGSFPMSVDDRRLLLLATQVPLWRDLTSGIQGPDVSALQRELGRLGLTVRTTGRYDAPTQRAVAALYKRAQQRPPSGALTRSALLWIPAPSVRISSCDVQLNGRLSDGSPVMTLVQQVTSAHVKVMPSNLLPGSRQVSIDDVKVPIGPEGRITNASDLGRLTALAPARTGEATAPQPLHGTVVLSEPIAVVGVPPTAIFGLRGTSGCVLTTDGAVVRVSIVSSMLGRALVTWSSEGSPGTKVLIAPPEQTTCE